MQAIRHFENDSPEMSESKQFAAAMIILSAKARIYWRLVVMSEVIWTYRVPTAATDGIYIYINPDFFNGLASDSQRAFLLGHEVGHMILKHPQRGKAFRKRGYFRVVEGVKIPFSHRLYNCAGDYVINADLIAHGLEPIESGLFDDRFGRNHLVDEVYVELYEEQQTEDEEDDQDQDQDDQGDQDAPDDATVNPFPTADESGDSGEGGQSGSGDSSENDDSEDDEDADGSSNNGSGGDDCEDDEQSGDGSEGTEHDGHDVHLEPKYEGTEEEIEAAEKEDERAIDKATEDGAEQQRQAIKDGDHKDVGFGDAVGERLKASENRMSAPVTWRDEIPDLLQRSGKGSETSFAKIHRRRFNLYGVVSPVTKGALHQIGFVVDISASVDRNALRECMHVLADAIDELQPSGGAVVVFCSDYVAEGHVFEVFSGAELLDLEIPCGGGTNMSAGIEWLEENGYDPDVTLVFTDAEMYDWDMRQVVENGAVIVLDGQPSSYARWVLEAANARVITVDDNSIAA